MPTQRISTVSQQSGNVTEVDLGRTWHCIDELDLQPQTLTQLGVAMNTGPLPFKTALSYRDGYALSRVRQQTMMAVVKMMMMMKLMIYF